VSSVAPSASTAPKEHRHKLTAKQRSFAEALAADPTLNAHPRRDRRRGGPRRRGDCLQVAKVG